MLPRRHLVLLACPAAAAFGVPKRALAWAAAPAPRELGVRIASPTVQGRFEALARRVAEASGGEFRLAARDRGARGGAPAAVLGGLAFGRAAPGAPLEPFAGFPFGMGPQELEDWLRSRDGAALWSGGFSQRRMRAFPCAVAVFPGWLLSTRAITAPSDLQGLTVSCRTDGVLGSSLRDLAAVPVETAAEALLPAATHASPEHAGAAAFGCRPGPVADRRARSYRLCPAFGAVVELALSEAARAAVEPRFLEVLEHACAAEFGASLAGSGGVAAGGLPGPPPVPAAVAERAAARVAFRLQEHLARPEATALGAAAEFAAARLAGLRSDVWG